MNICLKELIQIGYILNSKSNLEFKSLDPGKYTLKIRARDGHGELSEETSINIKVKTPIWKTPLAYLIYLIIISSNNFYYFKLS